METRDAFISEDAFDGEEALESVLEKKKLLLKRLLKHNTFSENKGNNTLNYSF